MNNPTEMLVSTLTPTPAEIGKPVSSRGFKTHDVTNVPPEVVQRNIFEGDQIMADIVKNEKIEWASDKLSAMGKICGATRTQELARLANEEKPKLRTHNRIGERINFVEYHPSYHELMSTALSSEVHSLSWTSNEANSETARGLLSYMWSHVEQGTLCPLAMTYSMPGLLRADPEIGDRWLDKVLSPTYDPRQIAPSKKAGLTVAMSFTEKQGGSDMRANSTVAVATGNFREYLITGHKFFCSAPMGDLILITAQTKSGVSLFVVPRILEDDTQNTIEIRRLKDKLGNRSNASTEIELNDTVGYLIGEEGHGVKFAMDYMSHPIRLEMAFEAAGLMRQSFLLAHHHVSNRKAFGKTISDLPQMRNGLADMAIESEANLRLAVRVSRALEKKGQSDKEASLYRLLTPIAKFWNCRRASTVAMEALECHGGMGYVEEQPIARLYREAPINNIWEGTAAMMGLDVIRSLKRHPETIDAVIDELRLAKGMHADFDIFIPKLEKQLRRPIEEAENHSRRLMSMIAVGIQGGELLRSGDSNVAQVFCSSRLGRNWEGVMGSLDEKDYKLRKIVDRAAAK